VLKAADLSPIPSSNRYAWLNLRCASYRSVPCHHPPRSQYRDAYVQASIYNEAVRLPMSLQNNHNVSKSWAEHFLQRKLLPVTCLQDMIRVSAAHSALCP